jgi:hypothetical protein
MLCAVDALIYAPEDFGDYTRIEEVYGHVEVGDRHVAVVCRDGSGIYTVEQHLKTRWGDQLSLIALENEPGQYTLRRVSTLAGPKLSPAYERLNRLDRAYRPLSWWTRTRKSIGAFLVGLSCLLSWSLANFFPSPFWDSGARAGVEESYAFAIASLLTLTIGMLLTRSASQRRPWVFGWRTTVDGGGWWLLPFAMIGATPAAIWASTSIGTRPTEFAAALGAGAFAIAAGEVWFRGLVHGMLVPDFSVQRPRGAWLLSRAAMASSAAYAVVATVMATPAFKHPLLAQSGASEIEIALGAGTLFFVVGLALAALRERSLSFLPGLLVQIVGLGIAAAVGALFS